MEATMLKTVLRIGAIALVSALVAGAVAMVVLPNVAEAAYGPSGRTADGGVIAPLAALPATDAGYVGDLTESEVEALNMALDDEYKAWSVYDQVISDLGAVRPFTNILKAEEAHIAALVTLYDRYGLDVPANEWPGNVPSYDTLNEACAAGVEAEIANAALYDQLFSMVDNPDLVRVFTSLQAASQTKHLPAFERCAD
jgi:hypothetical protein